jgi:ABC-type sugar transport system ATPase subunit
MASLELKQVVKDFEGTRVIHGVDLQVKHGEFTVFVGPSGCGKSTLLRLICGLEEVTSGDILIDDKRVNHLRAADRELAMVFQSYALYPHMTVHQNMAFGLENLGMPKGEVQRRVMDAAVLLRLDEPAAAQADPAVGRPAAARGDRPRHRARAEASSCSTSRCPTWTPSCACQMRVRDLRAAPATWARP